MKPEIRGHLAVNLIFLLCYYTEAIDKLGTFTSVHALGTEWIAIARDVAASEPWRECWSFRLRGPGWAYDNRRTSG